LIDDAARVPAFGRWRDAARLPAPARQLDVRRTR
jgi:hypothetical protein